VRPSGPSGCQGLTLIKAAAIQRISDGRVWTGHRHHNVIHTIVTETGIKSVPRHEFTQGFVTEAGIFVDRCEAHKIATDCKQIPDRGHDLFDILISEDLY
jgi:hypothetical protein